MFLLNLFSFEAGNIPEMNYLSPHWSGAYSHAIENGGGGFMSAAPIYLGLVAIAGALLLKGTDNKNA